MELQLASSLSLTILLVLVAFSTFIKKKTRVSGSTSSLPGPWKLPVIGSMHHMLAKLPHRAICDLARKHGPLMLLRLGQIDHIVVSSREAAREIMKTHDLNFAYRPQFAATKILSYGFNNIAFSPYGGHWRQLRKICTMELLSNSRVKSFSSMREAEISRLMQHISVSANKPIDLTEKVTSMVNNVISRAAFGDECRHQQRFLSAMEYTSKVASGFSVVDLFPSLQFIDIISGFRSKAERIHRQMDEIFVEIIEEHRARKADTQRSDREDLIDVLLRLRSEGGLEIPIADDNIKAVILDMFIGGTATSSSIVIWAMAELMRNPELMRKAQKEIREALKGKGRIEDSDLCKLSFLNLVIKETLRLHPSAPLLLPRVCNETCRVLEHDIAAGTRVIVNAWAIGRDPRYWEDAHRFKPERFEGSDIDFKGKDFQYLPFGAGRRICPGITFGLANVEAALAHLLFYFDWELPGGMKAEDLDMTESFGLSGSRKAPLSLLPIPRIQVPIV